MSTCVGGLLSGAALLRQVHFAVYYFHRPIGIFHLCCCCREDKDGNKTLKKRDSNSPVGREIEKARERATAALAPGHLSRWAPMILGLGWNPPKCRTIYLFIGGEMQRRNKSSKRSHQKRLVWAHTHSKTIDVYRLEHDPSSLSMHTQWTRSSFTYSKEETSFLLLIAICRGYDVSWIEKFICLDRL